MRWMAVMIESSRCVCAGLLWFGPPAVAETKVAAAGVEQTVIRIAGLRCWIELHRAHGMGQVRNDVGRAQEFAPRPLERVGSRVDCVPLLDDVVVRDILQSVPGWNEVRRFWIAWPALAVHRVEQAIHREFRVKDETDETALEAVINRKWECRADVGV